MSEPFDFEGETDLELLGGKFDDEPKVEETPVEPEVVAEEHKAEEPEVKAEEPIEEEEPQPKRDAVIPRARFDEVNAKLHAEREEAARLRAELEALSKPKTPQAEINVDSLEDAYFEAIINGDKDKAREIRSTINAEIYNRAKAASEDVVTTTLTQREIQSSFSKAVEQTVSDYPFLDSTSPEASPEAIGEVVEWRDMYISKGDSPAVALQKAAAKVAPLYAPKPEVKEDPVVPAPVDKRKQAALALAAKTAGSQPPPVEAGIGNRAIPLGDDLISDQNKWDKASDAERLRLLA